LKEGRSGEGGGRGHPATLEVRELVPKREESEGKLGADFDN